MNFFKFKSSDIKRESAVNEIYFQHPAWKLIALNEKLNGIWPLQKRSTQISLQIFHFFGMLSMMFALLNGLRTVAAGEPEIILENAFWITFTLCLVTIQIVNFIKQRLRQKFYEKIVKQYDAVESPEEAASLAKSAEDGSRFAVDFVATLMVFTLIFYFSPMARAYYDYWRGLDNKLKLMLGTGLDYGVDHAKYWPILLPVYLNFFFSGFVVGTGFECSFILQVRHVQTLFQIVRMRLIRATEIEDNDEESYSIIVSAIKLHLECFEMVDMMEESYSTFFFAFLIANGGIFAMSLHMVTHNMEDPLDAVRFSCVLLLVTIHFFIVYYHGQMIIDSSLTVANMRYECNWLNMPNKSRRLFTVLMRMQSTDVRQLTGGKLFPLSMETFAKMFKAGLSYYTVLEQ